MAHIVIITPLEIIYCNLFLAFLKFQIQYFQPISLSESEVNPGIHI